MPDHNNWIIYAQCACKMLAQCLGLELWRSSFVAVAGQPCTTGAKQLRGFPRPLQPYLHAVCAMRAFQLMLASGRGQHASTHSGTFVAALSLSPCRGPPGWRGISWHEVDHDAPRQQGEALGPPC